MTRQALAGQPITVVARSQVGGFIPDAALNIDGEVFSNADCTESFDEHRANGAGEFVFYAEPGSVITVSVDDPIAVDLEPIQVVGTTTRPGGLAAVHPDDTPEVHEASPVSDMVSDASLVGAPAYALPEDEGGAAAAVRAADAEVIEPGPPADQATPDGTTATDPDAVAPPAVQEEQVTPQYEPVADPNATEMRPEQVTEVDPPAPAEPFADSDIDRVDEGGSEPA
jgi:hypothetical protein